MAKERRRRASAGRGQRSYVTYVTYNGLETTNNRLHGEFKRTQPVAQVMVRFPAALKFGNGLLVEEVFMQALQTTTEISFKNILFLTDLSEASESALAYAVGFAKHYNSQLYPAHACSPIVLTENTTVNVFEEIVENSRRQLSKIAKDNKTFGPPLFSEADIEIALPGWLEERGIDLVVVGTHGRRGLTRFLLGSTAEFVFRNATCPVLTVGPHVGTRPYNGFKVDHILFPTDLKPHSDAAISYALSFARETHARLTFMHVVSLDQSFQQDRGQLVAEARGRLQRLIPSDAGQWCSPELVVEVGDPTLEITGFAERERPDIIVLGLPPKKEFSAHFQTGVTYKVVSSAPCPVLTVRGMAK
jgi:nucleotide-binding universal stress UspA family protein